jgi:uncharacterized membrane protein YozB (DUF420 family)
MTYADLPAVNAGLNTISAFWILAGYACIRRGRRRAHGICMAMAVLTSALFLASYLTYHAHAGATRFSGQGWIRPVYFGLLISHSVLAVVIVPMVLATVYRAARRRWDTHKRLARLTWPLWLYVSVTGVLVYWMLYHLYPPR